MTGTYHFLDQRRLIDRDGVASGGIISFYISGTSVFAGIYHDIDLTVPMDNPVVIDADADLPEIYLDLNTVYRRRIVYPDGTVDDVDPIPQVMTYSQAEDIIQASIVDSLGTATDKAPSQRAVQAALDEMNLDIDTIRGAVTSGVAGYQTWANLYDAYQPWSNVVAYNRGDTAVDQGAFWLAIAGSTNQAPPTLPSQSNAYWQLKILVPQGQLAQVPITDTGTHTDVFGGTGIPNSGIYVWRLTASASGWYRIYATDAALAKPYADAAAASAVTADGFSDLAQAWAEGTNPGGGVTKSSREWAGVSEDWADTAAAAAAAIAFLTDFQGPGAVTGTGAQGSSDLNTWLGADQISQSGFIDSTDIYVVTGGAGNIQGYLLSRQPGGTFNVETTGPTHAFASTGVQSFDWGGLAVQAGWYRAFRRTGNTAAQLAISAISASGASYLITGAPSPTGNTAAAGTSALMTVDHIRATILSSTLNTNQDHLANGAGGPWDQNKIYTFGDNATNRASASGTMSSKASAFGMMPIVPTSGYLDSVTFNATVAGLVEIYVTRPTYVNDGAAPTASVLKKFWLTAGTTGDNTFTAGTHFSSLIRVEKGDVIHLRPMSATVKSISRGAYIAAAPQFEGGTVTFTNATVSPAMEVTVRASVNITDTLFSNRGGLARESRSVYRNRFTSGTGMTFLPGSFTIGSGGLVSPAAGSLTSTYTAINQVFVFSHEKHRIRFKMAQPCNFGMVWNGSKGGLVNLDFTAGFNAGTMNVSSFNGATTVANETRTIPWTAVANQVYEMEVERNRFTMTFTLRDTLNYSNVLQFSRTRVAQSNIFMMMAQFGFSFISGSGSAGDVTILDHECVAGLGGGQILCIGDSNMAFGGAVPSATEVYDKGYVDMINATRNRGDVLNCGYPGADSTQGLSQAQMLIPILRPKLVFVAHGTNNATSAQWQSDMVAIKALCDALGNGCEMVLATVPPKPAGQAVPTAINALVLAYFNGCRYVDLAAMVSQNQDRVTWIVAYTDDNVHCNRVGQALGWYAAMPSNAPFFFDGYQ